MRILICEKNLTDNILFWVTERSIEGNYKLGNCSFSQQALVVFKFYNSTVVLQFEETAEE